ncbi:MAG: endonuclease III [Chlamydiia bacterium]|nr:endonuclease III [Chlamydiia bacterium]
MRKREWVQRIEQILDAYVPDPEVPLHATSPFTLLIAVLLSAQCTDARVNQVTPRLFERADTAAKMLALHVEQIEEIIRPCGLYKAKAKAILGLSKILVEKYRGKVPQTLEELEELPGVGHKTASAVVSHAFHIPAFPVDTHIHRCAKRWGLSSGKSVQQTEADLKKAFPKKEWIRRHLQIILFARKYCPARGHRVTECPICREMV